MSIYHEILIRCLTSTSLIYIYQDSVNICLFIIRDFSDSYPPSLIVWRQITWWKRGKESEKSRMLMSYELIELSIISKKPLVLSNWLSFDNHILSWILYFTYSMTTYETGNSTFIFRIWQVLIIYWFHFE